MNVRSDKKSPIVFASLLIILSLIFPIQSWGEGPSRIKLEDYLPPEVKSDDG